MVDSNGAEELSPLEIFISDCAKEYEQIQREISEIDLLVQQSTGEVDKLARRHATAAGSLRHIQANIDTLPRADIVEAYEVVQDAQQRLFTMRGQLEKLQSDHKNMERYMKLLQRVLDEADPSAVAAGGRGGRYDSDVPIIVRVVEAQEAERRRLSRSMHDGPAQSMTNFILQTEICQRLYEADTERSRTELIALKGAATDTFQRIRDFIFELRPMMLDDLGLVPTIRRYAENYRTKHNIPVEVTILGKDRRLEPYVEVTAFRILQELLNNVRDHAQANQVRVQFELDDQTIRLIIDDNGVGFDVEEAVIEARHRRTVGLSTMGERVEMLGGDLEISSQVGQGTHVVVTLPVGADSGML